MTTMTNEIAAGSADIVVLGVFAAAEALSRRGVPNARAPLLQCRRELKLRPRPNGSHLRFG